MTAPVPYLSLVVAARNDDHGGNLLGRMQAFVNAWIAQCKRHRLSSELIIVEWNPPEDRPRLVDALRWPADLGPCRVRFIEVPPEIHRRYRHADSLPLYQMIAKNVGIRRAAGQFVLATNIDILFSDELVGFLAQERLEKGRMYRIDRYDAMADVPADGLDEQLAYCRSHLIRLHAREGSFKLTPDGRRALEPVDIASADSGISFGSGWFPVERYSPNEPFRWVDTDAEMTVQMPAGAPPLMLEMEPGPGVGGPPFLLQLLGDDDTVLADWYVWGRTRVQLQFPPGAAGARSLRFHVVGGGRPVVDDARSLNFRVFRCEWARGWKSDWRSDAPGVLNTLRGTARMARVLRRLLGSYRGDYTAFAREGIRGCLRAAILVKKVAQGGDIFQPDAGIIPGEGWYPLEHGGGETFRWVGKSAELTVRMPAEVPCKLAMLVEPGPGVGFGTFELLVRQLSGETLARAVVDRLKYVEVALPLRPGRSQRLCLTLEGGGLATAGDSRTLNFRLLGCGWAQPCEAVPSLADRLPDAGSGWAVKVVSLRPGFDWVTHCRPVAETIQEMGTPVFLHWNACGDFTLLAREHWFDLRGYPEFDLFSMNLDSVFCYAAHHAGAREEMLREPSRIYHIEHGTGSGWTPEGADQLYQRIAAKGLTFIRYEELVGWVAQMRQLDSPIIFNMEDWGLSGLDLRETEVRANSLARALR